MNRSLSAGALFALTAFAAPIFAQEPPKASSPKLLTPEASLNLRSISDLQFSPDGNRLAFVVTEPAKGERRARHIWIYEKQSGSIRQFTYSAKSDFLPRWSPDGKQIAYLAPDAKTEAEEKKEKDKDDAHVVDKEDKHARLWLLTLDAGEA